MRHIGPLKAGAAVGAVLGLWHLIWVTLVGVGWAKPVMDFILRLHFINLHYGLAPFDVTTAATLVILTFVIGIFVGVVFALAWNWLSIESAPSWTRDTGHGAPAE